MTLSDLAALGSFVSGIAVLATLVLVLLQMRQANQNQRALMQGMRSARLVETILHQSEPHVSEAIGRALQHDLSMPEPQLRSFLLAMNATFANWEDSFLQHRAGVLDDEGLQSDAAVIRSVMRRPAHRAAWKLQRDRTIPAFRAFVDRIVDETRPALDHRGLAAAWKKMLTEELAAAEAMRTDAD